jgi:riboflavin synthase
MFTGLVEEAGRVRALVRDEGGARLTVACVHVLDDATIGSSIAVDGCCLTVAEMHDGAFSADVMGETLRRTTIGDMQPGDAVNLERPLRADGRLGGHLVQGHVDAVGHVTAVHEAPDSRTITISVPAEIGQFIVEKGSIGVNGVSLTVIDFADAEQTTEFRVGIIPHTAEVTNLGTVASGDRVNLEADLVGKYVARLAAGYLSIGEARHV